MGGVYFLKIFFLVFSGSWIFCLEIFWVVDFLYGIFYMNSFPSHWDIAHNFLKANWINEQANRSIIWIVEIVMFVEQYNELTSHACFECSFHSYSYIENCV
jgi:hypothetical protein